MAGQMLAGKVAIVTGAGGGIGRAYSAGLAGAGAKVVLADLNLDNAQAAADVLAADGHDVIAVQADVSDEASANDMAVAAVDAFGGIDILVNNAGLMAEVVTKGTLTTMPIDLWHQVLAVNLTGPLLCTRAVLASMRERGWGKIVNQSSSAAWLGGNAYGASKLGVVSLTISLAKELAPFGIRVNAIAPGLTDTPAGQASTPGPVREYLAQQIPFPFGRTDDLVAGLLYLVGPSGDWVTGHSLNIDGGWVVRT